MLFFYATKLRNVTNTKWYLLQMENIAKRNRVSPNGETLIQKQTHTDKELAKMAGVGTGTVARKKRRSKTAKGCR